MLTQWVDSNFGLLSQSYHGRTIIHVIAMVNDHNVCFHLFSIYHELKEIAMAFHQITDNSLVQIISNFNRDGNTKPLTQPDPEPKQQDGEVFVVRMFEKKED